MSHERIVSIALAGLVFSTLGAAPPNEAPKKSDRFDFESVLRDNIELKQENQKLKAEVKMLQTQLVEQQKFLGAADPKSLPPGWKQGKINGLTFYIVPCDENANSAQKPTVKLLDK